VAVASTANRSVIARQKAAADALHVPYHAINVTGLMPDHVHLTAEGGGFHQSL